MLLAYDEYLVDFDTCGGIFDGQERTVITAYGKTLPAPIPPTKSGHKFLGWFIDSKTPFVFEDQENPTRVYCDINLFARWQINSYTVYYYDDPNQQPCFVREVLADEPIVNI